MQLGMCQAKIYKFSSFLYKIDKSHFLQYVVFVKVDRLQHM